MASRISSSFVRGFRVLAGCRSADSGAASNPIKLMGSAVNQASYADNPRAITYHSADVHGINIHYTKTGNGKSPVLLLPGALGCAQTDFLPQLEGFNKDMFTLIAWDPRGYGRSQDTPRDWSNHFLERDAHDAAMLMKTLNYDSFSMVGWSDGGITALIVAAKFPNRIRKCVSVAANSYITKEEMDSYMKIADVGAWSERMRKPFIDVYGEEKFERLWAEWIQWFATYYHDNDGNICKHMLKDIKCPLLVVQGQSDPLVPLAHAEYLHKNVPGSRLAVYAKGKHNLHLKFPKDFNSLVENYLIEPISMRDRAEPTIPEQ